MIIICDFDGTITIQDVTNELLDHFTGRDWRELLEPYKAGKLTHLDIMQQSYAALNTSEEELLDYARRNIQIRSHFEDLVTFCKKQGWPLVVVSGGIDFYLKALLDQEILYHSYLGQYVSENNGWQVRMPDWPEVDLKAGHDFKVRVVEEFQSRFPGHKVAFIGNGRNDWPAARHSDLRFTVANSRLSELCKEAGIAYTDFEDFSEVTTALEKSGL